MVAIVSLTVRHNLCLQIFERLFQCRLQIADHVADTWNGVGRHRNRASTMIPEVTRANVREKVEGLHERIVIGRIVIALWTLELDCRDRIYWLLSIGKDDFAIKYEKVGALSRVGSNLIRQRVKAFI